MLSIKELKLVLPPKLCYIHPASPQFPGVKVNIASEGDNSNCHHLTQVSLPAPSSMTDDSSEQLYPYHFATENKEDDQMCFQFDHTVLYHTAK